MPPKSNGALRVERVLAEYEHRARREAKARGRRRRYGRDEYMPTRADRRVAAAAALG